MKKVDLKKKLILLVLVVSVFATVFMTGAYQDPCDDTWHLELGGDTIFDYTGSLTLDKGTYYFEFSDQGDYWGCPHVYSLYNYEGGSIKVYMDTKDPNFDKNKCLATVYPDGEYNLEATMAWYRQTDYTTGTETWLPYSAKFKVVLSKKTKFAVSSMIHFDVKTVAKKNFKSHYWMPYYGMNDAVGLSDGQIVSKMFLTKNDAIALGKVFTTKSVHNSIKNLTNSNVKDLYAESIAEILSNALEGYTSTDGAADGLAGAASALIVGILSKTFAYKDLVDQLQSVGNELKNVTVPQTLTFDKNVNKIYYKITRQNGIDHDGGSNYHLIGAPGYYGEYVQCY